MKSSQSARWPLAASLVFIASLSSADAPPGRYTVAANTVTDTKTGLVWQRVDDGNTYAWAAAGTHCTALSLDGNGWRLPTEKELQTIVDDTQLTAPMIDPVFTNTASSEYWSATPWGGSPTFVAWFVNFTSGTTLNTQMTTASHVRCVR